MLFVILSKVMKFILQWKEFKQNEICTLVNISEEKLVLLTLLAHILVTFDYF